MSEPSYAYWHAALAMTGGRRALTRDEMKSLCLTEEPGLGFFRRRMSRGGPFAPVAIFMHGDPSNMIALSAGKPVDAVEVWTYCAPHPVSEEAYRAKVDGGKWPDEDEAVTESLPAAIGDNDPPQDEVETLRGQIQAASANAADYVQIGDDETASKAQSVRSRLLELHGIADKKRTALVRPHLDAENAINALWMPLVKEAKTKADSIKKALDSHETQKLRAEEKRAADAVAAAEAVSTLPKPSSPPGSELAPVEAPKTQVRGAYGRAAAVKLVKLAQVDDQDKVYQAFRTDAEIIARLQKLAQKAVDAGISIEGISIVQERKVT